MKPLLKVGMSRELSGNDIYAVLKTMQSDQNTNEFENSWRLEVKTKNPSSFRVMLKLHGFKVLAPSILYPIGSTIAR